MGNFDAHKWFKKQYLEEGMSPEEYDRAKEAERLENHPEKDKIKAIQGMLAKERPLKEDMLQSQFEDLYQVVRNIHHVGGYDSIEDAAFEALQRIGEEFGVNFEEGRF